MASLWRTLGSRNAPVTHRNRFPACGGGLLVVDLQERLLAPMRWRDLVVANSIRLVRAAQILGMTSWATEQYPGGLGGSVAVLAELIPTRPAKMAFSAGRSIAIEEQVHGRKITHLTVAGIEAHVCVLQTVLDLLAQGFCVQVPADAVASRCSFDWRMALDRMRQAGAVITTTEAVLFEWVETAEHPGFKAISNLIKEFVRPSESPVPAQVSRAGTGPAS